MQPTQAQQRLLLAFNLFNRKTVSLATRRIRLALAMPKPGIVRPARGQIRYRFQIQSPRKPVEQPKQRPKSEHQKPQPTCTREPTKQNKPTCAAESCLLRLVGTIQLQMSDWSVSMNMTALSHSPLSSRGTKKKKNCMELTST